MANPKRNYKVAFYAPVKNEERFIREFVEYHMRTIKKGDVFVFVDTGSTDNTVKIIKEMIAERKPVIFYDDYPQDHVFSFDFIRNYALTKVPPKIDICIALDIDEFMVKDNWRDVLVELAEETNNNFILVNNRWEDMSEERGVEKSFFIHQRSAIHSRNPNIYWKFPVHECLHNGDPNTKVIDRSDFITAHMRNQKKERVSYKKIIVDYLKTKPKLADVDMMHLYYIEGNEYYAAGEHKNAIKAYNTYLKYTEKFDKVNMTAAYYNNTCAVYVKMSIMYRQAGDLLKELKYKHLAFATKPCRETAIMLSMYYLNAKKPLLAKQFFDIGASYTDKNLSYNAIDWFWNSKNMEGLRLGIESVLNPTPTDNATNATENQEIPEVEIKNENQIQVAEQNL